MKKRIAAAVMAAMMVLTMAGCGKKVPPAIGLVAEGTDAGAAAEIASGIATYASGSGSETKTYTVADSTADAYKTQFDAAADDGMKIVVTDGTAAEIPLYEAQKSHKKVRYVMFDGAPRKEEGADASIRKNTVTVHFDEADMGFIAGYAAVENGFTKLGFLSGKQTKTSDKYRQGFIDGAEYAAQKENASEGSIVVMTEYAGTDELMPLRATDAILWYNDGCDYIVTDKPSLAPALLTAADTVDDKYCGFLGFTPATTLSTDSVLFSSIPNYTDAVNTMLEEAAAGGKTFKGGSTVDCGFSEGAIALGGDFSKAANFTEDAYQSFLNEAKAGITKPEKVTIVTVSETAATDPALLTNGTGEASSDASPAESAESAASSEDAALSTEEASSEVTSDAS